VLGPSRAERLIHVQMAATLALAIALVPLGVLPAVALLPIAAAAFVGWRELVAMHRRGYSHATKAASMGGVSKVFLAYTVAVLAGIGLGTAGLP
jgi:4-hydroxybenzoate polyprenyltransferase